MNEAETAGGGSKFIRSGLAEEDIISLQRSQQQLQILQAQQYRQYQQLQQQAKWQQQQQSQQQPGQKTNIQWNNATHTSQLEGCASQNISQDQLQNNPETVSSLPWKSAAKIAALVGSDEAIPRNRWQKQQQSQQQQQQQQHRIRKASIDIIELNNSGGYQHQQQQLQQQPNQVLPSNQNNNNNTPSNSHTSSSQLIYLKDLQQERMIQRIKSLTVHQEISIDSQDRQGRTGKSSIHIPGRSTSKEREVEQTSNISSLESTWSIIKKQHNFDTRSNSKDASFRQHAHSQHSSSYEIANLQGNNNSNVSNSGIAAAPLKTAGLFHNVQANQHNFSPTRQQQQSQNNPSSPLINREFLNSSRNNNNASNSNISGSGSKWLGNANVSSQQIPATTGSIQPFDPPPQSSVLGLDQQSQQQTWHSAQKQKSLIKKSVPLSKINLELVKASGGATMNHSNHTYYQPTQQQQQEDNSAQLKEKQQLLENHQQSARSMSAGKKGSARISSQQLAGCCLSEQKQSSRIFLASTAQSTRDLSFKSQQNLINSFQMEQLPLYNKTIVKSQKDQSSPEAQLLNKSSRNSMQMILQQQQQQISQWQQQQYPSEDTTDISLSRLNNAAEGIINHCSNSRGPEDQQNSKNNLSYYSSSEKMPCNSTNNIVSFYNQTMQNLPQQLQQSQQKQQQSQQQLPKNSQESEHELASNSIQSPALQLFQQRVHSSFSQHAPQQQQTQEQKLRILSTQNTNNNQLLQIQETIPAKTKTAASIQANSTSSQQKIINQYTITASNAVNSQSTHRYQHSGNNNYSSSSSNITTSGINANQQQSNQPQNIRGNQLQQQQQLQSAQPQLQQQQYYSWSKIKNGYSNVNNPTDLSSKISSSSRSQPSTDVTPSNNQHHCDPTLTNNSKNIQHHHFSSAVMNVSNTTTAINNSSNIAEITSSNRRQSSQSLHRANSNSNSTQNGLQYSQGQYPYVLHSQQLQQQSSPNKNSTPYHMNPSGESDDRDVKQLIINKIQKMKTAKICLKEGEEQFISAETLDKSKSLSDSRLPCYSSYSVDGEAAANLFQGSKYLPLNASNQGSHNNPTASNNSSETQQLLTGIDRKDNQSNNGMAYYHHSASMYEPSFFGKKSNTNSNSLQTTAPPAPLQVSQQINYPQTGSSSTCRRDSNTMNSKNYNNSLASSNSQWLSSQISSKYLTKATDSFTKQEITPSKQPTEIYSLPSAPPRVKTFMLQPGYSEEGFSRKQAFSSGADNSIAGNGNSILERSKLGTKMSFVEMTQGKKLSSFFGTFQ